MIRSPWLRKKQKEMLAESLDQRLELMHPLAQEIRIIEDKEAKQSHYRRPVSENALTALLYAVKEALKKIYLHLLNIQNGNAFD